MNPLALFDTLGLILGPAMMLGVVGALVLCLRASRRPDSPRALRVALLSSFLPFIVGLCAIPFALMFVPAGESLNWLAVGKACLAGLVVTLFPLVWSLSLMRPRRNLA